ncbi:MAG: hypothetical protein ACRD1X_13680 [Vicinamibacteria bacterium]
MASLKELDRGPGTRSLGPRRLAGLGVLSVSLFWVPFAAPLIQAVTLIQCIRAARWGVAEAWSLGIGVGGAVVGFALFLARGYLGL